MNWDTIIVAIIGAAATAAVALGPMYVKRRDEGKAAQEAKEKGDIDTAKQANEALIRNLSDRILELTKDRDEAEQRLDAEREKRRAAEQQAGEWKDKNYELAIQLRDANRIIERLSRQVVELGGAPQTGPLKPQP
jgi:chromosome segregation ATPase